jgi:ParB-like nuclease domain
VKEPAFKVHPLAELFPAMPPEDFQELKESIRKYGLFEPIIVNGAGQILDGRHRYRALLELGMGLKAYQSTIGFEEIQTKDKPLTEEQFIYDSNIHRRHLTKTQIAAILLSFTNLATVAKTTQKGKSTEALGKQSGVSGRLIRRVKAIKERDPKRFEEVRTGKLEVRDVERAFDREDCHARVQALAEERERNPPQPPEYTAPAPPPTPAEIEEDNRRHVEFGFDEFVDLTHQELGIPPKTILRWVFEYLERVTSGSKH